jgi:hypothetical protein
MLLLFPIYCLMYVCVCGNRVQKNPPWHIGVRPYIGSISRHIAVHVHSRHVVHEN